MSDSELTEHPINRYRGYNPDFVKRILAKRQQEKREAALEKFRAERLAKAEEKKRMKEAYLAAKRLAEREAKRREALAKAECAKERARQLEEKASLEIQQAVPKAVNDDVPIKDIIMEVAIRFGVKYHDIIGQSRTRCIVRIRWLAIAEVRRRKPLLSLPQIGKAFNRDHTTILHALQQMGLPTAYDELPAVVPNREKVGELQRNGFSLDEIGEIFGCHAETISRALQRAA